MADPLIEGELASGEFKRQQSRFRDSIGGGAPPGADATLPAVAGRYHLYVSLACPWCHRTVIVRELAGLTEALGVSYLAPFRDERGWAFAGDHFDVPAANGEAAWGDEYVDRVNGWEFISEAYRLSDPDFTGGSRCP
jgi:putative glutathione S-transferase